jgi:hypothetical protein
MTRTMYDSITPQNIPADADLIAGYVNGLYANIPMLQARFPHARTVAISVESSENAGTVLDVENGDADPVSAPAWVKLRRAAGVDPTVYCNSSTWGAVQSAFKAAAVPEPHYWIAQYDDDPTIPAGAVAKQYADAGPYDISAVADYWPGVDPEEDDMPYTPQQLVQYAQEGATAAIQAERGTLVADNLWWWQHAVAGTVPAGSSPAAAAAIKAIHDAYQVLAAEPVPTAKP